MNQHKFSFRVTALVLLAAVMLGVFSARLYNVQVIEGAAQEAAPSGSYTYYTRVTAARGEILDRNGKVLVGNRASFNIVLIYPVLFSSEDPNGSLRALTNLAVSHGLELVDHLPVTTEKPYEYTKDQYSSVWNNYFKMFLAAREWDSDISAPQLIRRLRERYHIPDDWTEEEARRVISVRYELELRYCGTNLPNYVMLEDVDTISLAEITELNIPGVTVEKSTVREYYTDYAAHILGRVADMNPEEYEYYKQFDYAMDAKVGKEGLEKAFELELHATDGMLETTIASDGTILEKHYVTEPVAGNNVELSIDIDLQKVAEDSLENLILDLRENGLNGTDRGKDAEGGAVVAMSVKTGEVLVSASYPTFNLSTYAEDYNDLLEQDFAPLYNRAVQGTYPPGSTFKMVTTIAAINDKVIKPGYEINDLGVYRRFEDAGYLPRCMLYTTSNGTATHGSINVMEALSVSCNYYFYEIGWMTGIEAIDKTAKALGLGESTGIEIYEETGHRANPETKSALYAGSSGEWYGGDTVSAAIGQSENRFTPMQLCSYTSALANRGVRYQASFLRRVLSSDYEELVQEHTPTVLSTLEISDDAYAAYTEGMRLAVTSYSGTSHGLFGDYEVAVCAKTGTAEHGSGGSDNASFVLYAPAEDPEIAIAVYVEKGAQGGNLGKIAKAILDVYFSEASAVDTVPAENHLN
ncbi:MAG: penicillin-binding transpeptidase domain-containing protein [Faecousia sp.]